MVHQPIEFSFRAYGRTIIHKSKNGFKFDKSFCMSEMDRAFYLSIFDINLITWDGDEYDWDLYCNEAEDDYKKDTFTITKIGEMHGQYFNIEMMQYSGFDMHNGDKLCLATTGLLDNKTNDFYDTLINRLQFGAPKAFFYVTHFEIYKPYRNKGYGSKVIKNIDKMLYSKIGYNLSFVALHCNPLDTDKHNNNKKEMKRLERFYEKCGFEHIGKGICMIKILDEFINRDV